MEDILKFIQRTVAGGNAAKNDLDILKVMIQGEIDSAVEAAKPKPKTRKKVTVKTED